MTNKIKAAIENAISANTLLANALSAAYNVPTVVNLLKDLGIHSINFGNGQWYGAQTSRDITILTPAELKEFPLESFLLDLLEKAGTYKEFWRYLTLVKGDTLFGIKDLSTFRDYYPRLTIQEKMEVIKTIRDFIKKRKSRLVGISFMTSGSGSEMCVVYGRIPTNDTQHWRKISGFDFSTANSASNYLKNPNCSKLCFQNKNVAWDQLIKEWGSAAVKPVRQFDWLICMTY
ncbi:hypothetical protein [Yersinia ruckeri]|uniref:hypothetical protein n=1 Tax=Yersinia ruckeri TaxID=29486 RepID=UPI00223759BB|nr:hypothetical protein [Yersinia ruckeri]MCW6598883.1 hypothetical protein [Yersinia ruckeri]